MGRMFLRLSAVLLLLGILSGVGFSAPNSDLLTGERIGRLCIGLSEGDVKKAVSCDLKRGPENLWGADGAYHQTWRCASCGLNLGMVSEKRGGKKAIESISLTGPATLSTKRGIRIGSSEQEVRKAYRAFWNHEDSKSRRNFVAGSVFGGMIFYFQDGKVRKLFLGAAAE